MVPRTLRKQIVLGFIAVGLFAAVYFLVFSLHKFTPQNPVYSAGGESFNLAVLDGIVAADKIVSKEGKGVVRAVVVPHHLVASKSIALGIKALASGAPRLIIIISPDHFFRCPKLLCTTKGSYKTFFGDVSISEDSVVQLERSSNLVADSTLFTGEHGIYTIVPFIKHYIPEAQIIPIAVSQHGRGTEQDRNEIIEILKPLLDRKDVGLVVSSDFSHYLPLAESNKMDIKTENSFCSGNSQQILMLQNPSQSDCPLCLWILEQEAQRLGFWNPFLIIHTNSANLLHDTSAKETTSHFTFTLSTVPSPGICAVIDSGK